MEGKIFELEYEFDNIKWADEFWAKDWDEAKRKLQSLKETIILLGELKETIPVWETTLNNRQN